MRQEQAQGRGFTGFDACIFLLIQAKYRGFTGTGGVATRQWRGSHPSARPALASSAFSWRHEKTRSLAGSRAQFQLWIFSYHVFGSLPKIMLSRINMA
jgi:hypothetical protein